ncbi:MAG: polyprenyl synthetase family protein, partial [Deltaproteobacteria bacterium]|nr:polyprenyl synthetase family protein [Deltaproteobacteria bacterium]
MKTLKQEITEAVEQDLAAIEEELVNNLDPYLELVRQVASHILFSGGKRLRPLLTVLCARLCGASGEEPYQMGVVFEYLHAATLLHDDVVDSSGTRRSAPAAHTVYGYQTAVLTGDYLFARACSMATKTGRLPVIQTITDVAAVMSQGEIQQMKNHGNIHLTEDEYLEVIKNKTAVLISGACRVGALCADADPGAVEALARFGMDLGMAFQMVDDLLDYTADPKAAGKPLGQDLKEGKLTLPLIHALHKASSLDRFRMAKIIGSGHCSEADFALILSRIRAAGGLAYTRQKAKKFIQSARK